MAIESVAYKCPNCGGSLEFDMFNQKFTCHFCGSAFSKEELDKHFTKEELTVEESFSGDIPEEKLESDWVRANNLYNCPSCGAGIITDNDQSVSVRCHYCNSPVVLSGRLAGEYCPDKIIPFVKDRAFAESAFKDWIGKKWFVPKSFKSERTLAEMKGIYVPFWLADCNVSGELVALGTKSTTSRHGSQTTTTHMEYYVERAGSLICRGVPADGSSKASDLLMENIEPYNYDALVDFDMSYLSGHSAEKYDVDKEVIFPRIEKRVHDEAVQEIKKTMKGYSTIKITKDTLRIEHMNWTYAMLPVWFLSYWYKGQLYCYAMNGQTGKFSGRIPLHKGKLALLAAIIALVFIAICTGFIFTDGGFQVL